MVSGPGTREYPRLWQQHKLFLAGVNDTAWKDCHQKLTGMYYSKISCLHTVGHTFETAPVTLHRTSDNKGHIN